MLEKDTRRPRTNRAACILATHNTPDSRPRPRCIISISSRHPHLRIAAGVSLTYSSHECQMYKHGLYHRPGAADTIKYSSGLWPIMNGSSGLNNGHHVQEDMSRRLTIAYVGPHWRRYANRGDKGIISIFALTIALKIALTIALKIALTIALTIARSR